MIYSSSRRRLLLTVIIVILLALAWLFSGGWFWKKPAHVISTRLLMNTIFNVQIFARDKKIGERLITEAFEEAQRIEHIMEPLKENGELKRINSREDDRWWILSADLRAVIEKSFNYYERSEGAFDPTIAPVKWLWDFENSGRVPSGSDLKEKLGSVGMRFIELHGDSLRFNNPGTKLDLGGVAKGYAVDRMIAVLKKGGALAGLVNAGGDISGFGKKPGGNDWIIGLRHPEKNRTLLIDPVSFASIATSGDYERCFIEDGVKYHHILDSTTGYPARGCVSVTVWTTSAMDADILSTTVFVMGAEKGVAFVESLEDVETLIFYNKGGELKTVMTSGIRGKIRF
ncbi:MAG: FAD:protein FMN transferase [Candidatus Latescibacteria bacterium]|jgi:FAD:protein FMN transferase|nr:FAD:protein FMN transferase [Candidatus Latescibacterota bacterium]